MRNQLEVDPTIGCCIIGKSFARASSDNYDVIMLHGCQRFLYPARRVALAAYLLAYLWAMPLSYSEQRTIDQPRGILVSPSLHSPSPSTYHPPPQSYNF